MLRDTKDTNVPLTVFEAGKAYRHRKGDVLRMVCEIDSTTFGRTLLAEDTAGSFLPCKAGVAVPGAWEEITCEEWVRSWAKSHNDEDDVPSKLLAAAAVDAARVCDGPARRPPYPRCPLCGGPVVGAMMTSGAVEVDGRRYYAPEAVSVYCSNGDCNYDRMLFELPYPPTEDGAP